MLVCWCGWVWCSSLDKTDFDAGLMLVCWQHCISWFVECIWCWFADNAFDVGFWQSCDCDWVYLMLICWQCVWCWLLAKLWLWLSVSDAGLLMSICWMLVFRYRCDNSNESITDPTLSMRSQRTLTWGTNGDPSYSTIADPTASADTNQFHIIQPVWNSEEATLLSETTVSTASTTFIPLIKSRGCWNKIFHLRVYWFVCWLLNAPVTC